jgi:hypothetical protein
MGQLPFAVNENYYDDGAWERKYRHLVQTTKKHMHIPIERPESPNFRLAKEGHKIQTSNIGSLNESVLSSVPQAFQGNPQHFNYATDREIASRGNIPIEQVNQLRSMKPGQIQGLSPQQQQMSSYRNNQQQPPMVQSQPIPQTCKLWEGADFYRPIDTKGFMAGAVNLCRFAGKVPGNWMIEFEVKGIRNCYVIPLNETRVDIAKIQANPQLLVPLVEVGCPMIGNILVPQMALQPKQPQQRQIMRDDMQNTRMQQPRKILMG